MPIYKINEGAGETLFKAYWEINRAWLRLFGAKIPKYTNQYDQIKRGIANANAHKEINMRKGINTEITSKIVYMRADERELDIFTKATKRISSYSRKYNPILKQIVSDFRSNISAEDSYNKLSSKLISLNNGIQVKDLKKLYGAVKIDPHRYQQDPSKAKPMMKMVTDVVNTRSIKHPPEIKEESEEYKNYLNYINKFKNKEGNPFEIEAKIDELKNLVFDIIKHIPIRFKK